MITRIEALGYRSLRYVSQDIQSFQVLVGPNGSGKSNFLDVVGFLGDLLRVGPLKAIVGDAAAQVGTRADVPSDMAWMGLGSRFELAVELTIPAERVEPMRNGKHGRARYEVAIETGGEGEEVGLAAETLWLLPDRQRNGEDSEPRQEALFPDTPRPPATIVREPSKKSPPGWRKVVNKIGSTGNDYFHAETTEWNNPFRLGPTRSALANLPEDESRFPVATWVKRVLMEGVQRVVLNADAMRTASPRGTPSRFLTDGSNLPWVIEDLAKRHPERLREWIDHVRTALPDLESIGTVEIDQDRRRYLQVVFANRFPAASWSVSDGTLRLLALTLLAYLPDANGVFLVEEPENGVHPRAVETVFQSLSSVYGAQVLCASHSPVVLGMARRDQILCFAKDAAGATAIVPGDKHPRLKDWQGALDLGTLFAAGVLG
jgi:hypothetical protein